MAGATPPNKPNLCENCYIYSKTIRPRLYEAKPACAGQSRAPCSRSGRDATSGARASDAHLDATLPLLPVWVERGRGDEGQQEKRAGGMRGKHAPFTPQPS